MGNDKMKDIVTIPNVGTFTVIDNELHFLDWFSREWESFNKEYVDFIFTKKEWREVKECLGNFEVYAN